MSFKTVPKADTVYYDQLEEGARYLASHAADDGERREHIGMANRYRRLALDSGARRP